MGKNCRNWLVLLAVFIVTVVSFAQADFEQGLTAADRGDYQTAVREWQVCAQTRDVRCQYNLAVAYLRGEGVAKNEKLAVTYLKKAASAGDALAKEKLSELHEQGRVETPPANTKSLQKPVRAAVSQKSLASGTRLLSRTYFQIFVTVLFGTSLLMLYLGLKKKLVIIFDEADAMVLFIGGACTALSFWLWFYRKGFLPKAMSAVVFLFAIGILWESYKTGVSKNKSFVIGTLVFPLRIVFSWLAPVMLFQLVCPDSWRAKKETLSPIGKLFYAVSLIGETPYLIINGKAVWERRGWLKRKKSTHTQRKTAAQEERRQQPARKAPVFDAYAVLQVTPNSTPEEIRLQYRKLITLYHPDKVNHLGRELQQLAHEKAIEIQRAYDCLSRSAKAA